MRENESSQKFLRSFQKSSQILYRFVAAQKKEQNSLPRAGKMRNLLDLKEFLENFDCTKEKVDPHCIKLDNYVSEKRGLQPFLGVMNKKLCSQVQYDGKENVAFSIDGLHGDKTGFLVTLGGRDYIFEQILVLRKIFLNEDGTICRHFVICMAYVGTKCKPAVKMFKDFLEKCLRNTNVINDKLDMRKCPICADFEPALLSAFITPLNFARVGCLKHFVSLIFKNFNAHLKEFRKVKGVQSLLDLICILPLLPASTVLTKWATICHELTALILAYAKKSGLDANDTVSKLAVRFLFSFSTVLNRFYEGFTDYMENQWFGSRKKTHEERLLFIKTWNTFRFAIGLR